MASGLKSCGRELFQKVGHGKNQCERMERDPRVTAVLGALGHDDGQICP